MLSNRKAKDALTGRMEIITLWPLAQHEIHVTPANLIDLLFAGAPPQVEDAPVGRAAFVDVVAAGGYPEALRREGRRRERWFRDYIDTTLDRDLRDMIAFPGVIGAGGGTVMPYSSLAPLARAILTARSFAARRTHLSEHAVRRIEVWDVAILLSMHVLVTALSFLTPQGDPTNARNAVLLTGASALATCVLGPAAATAGTTILVLLVVTYGRTAPGAGWIRVLRAPTDAGWPLGLSLGVSILACAALLTRARVVRLDEPAVACLRSGRSAAERGNVASRPPRHSERRKNGPDTVGLGLGDLTRWARFCPDALSSTSATNPLHGRADARGAC